MLIIKKKIRSMYNALEEGIVCCNSQSLTAQSVKNVAELN